MAREEEDRLLPRIAAGDERATRACIDRFGPLLWRMARTFLTDAARAEEVVQDVFVELWRTAARYDPRIASETTWITMIARRRLLDARRRSGRRRDLEPLDEGRLASADPALERIDTRDEAEHAARALATLEPDRRRVIALSVAQGLTHAEIAERTGLPLGTVKSHLRRGLSAVAARIAEERRRRAHPTPGGRP